MHTVPPTRQWRCNALVVVLLFVLVPLSALAATPTNNHSLRPRPFSVFGYLPEYRQEKYDYAEAFRSGLTHLIFFSAEVDEATSRLTHVEDRLPPLQHTAWPTIRTLADAHKVKLMLCVGGGGRSGGFARLVRERKRRAQFIMDVAQVVQTRALDGIDFNWEYPQDLQEWRGFVALLAELRQYMQQQQLSDSVESTRPLNLLRHDDFIISIALHPHPRLGTVLQEVGLLPFVDYIHFMAYDHFTPLSSANASHSSLDYAREVLQPSYLDAFDDTTYRTQLQQHQRRRKDDDSKPAVDHRRKITLGIPFYGRHYSNSLASTSSAVSTPREPESYARLCFFVKQWARKAHPEWNESSAALRAMNDYGGYAYNGYDIVQAKMRLARTSGPALGLAGIMVWELGQDLQPASREPLALLNAIAEQLRWWAREEQSEGTQQSTHADNTIGKGRVDAVKGSTDAAPADDDSAKDDL